MFKKIPIWLLAAIIGIFLSLNSNPNSINSLQMVDSALASTSAFCGFCDFESFPEIVGDLGFCNTTIQVYVGCTSNDGSKCSTSWNCMLDPIKN